MNDSLDAFVDDRSPASFYLAPTLRQRIDLTRHLIEFGRQIVLLSGAAGAGKSALMELICNDEERSWRVLKLSAGPTLNRRALLDRVCDELDIDVDNDERVTLATIAKYISAANYRGELTVLAIDDAHTLPADAAACLAALAHAAEPSEELKIFLTADSSQTGLVDQLQSESSTQALVHTIEIPRLGAEEMGQLLAHRWRSVYGDEDFPFTNADVAQIYQQSNGVPGKAVVLARQVQVLSHDAVAKAIDPARRFLIIGLGLVGLFVVFAFFNAEQKPEETAEVDLSLPNDEAQIDITLPQDADIVSLPAVPAYAEKTVVLPPRGPAATALDENRSTLPAEPRDASVLSPDDQAASAATTQRPIEASAAAPVSADAMPAAASNRKPVAQPDLPMPVPKPGPEPVPKSDKKPQAAPESKPAPKPTPKLAPAPNASPAAPEKHTSDGKSSEYSLDWLRQQPGRSYVLQLFGVRDHGAAEKFIRDKRISGESLILTTQHAGAPWYVVIYGHYRDRQTALAAADKLPPKLAGTKPWARPIDSLK